jgi:Mn-dependent DtxR family transcriptional regulator
MKKTTKELNSKELAVLRACAEAPATIADIAKRFRRADDDTQANSWVRNSVRKPVRLGLLKKTKRGTYALTSKGKAAAGGGAASAAA